MPSEDDSEKRAGFSASSETTQGAVAMPQSNILRSFLAGAVAGGLAKTMIAPLDRVKIHFQVTTTPFSVIRVFAFLAANAQQNGIYSLWRGNTAQLARILPYAAIQFAANEQYKRMLNVRPNDDSSPKRLFVAGALAGCTSVAATYPFDIARARLAVTTASRYRNLPHLFVVTMREEGLRGVYRGFSVTLLGQIPYTGVAFCTYETLKRLSYRYEMASPTKSSRRKPLYTFFSGAIAGLLGQTVAYPLDVVRRRWQTAGEVVDITALNVKSKTSESSTAQSINDIRKSQVNAQSYAVPKSQLGIWATMKHIAQTEGVRRGLFKGVSMNWLKGPAGVGISFLTFETTRDLLHRAGV